MGSFSRCSAPPIGSVPPVRYAQRSGGCTLKIARSLVSMRRRPLCRSGFPTSASRRYSAPKHPATACHAQRPSETPKLQNTKGAHCPKWATTVKPRTAAPDRAVARLAGCVEEPSAFEPCAQPIFQLHSGLSIPTVTQGTLSLATFRLQTWEKP